MGKGASFQLQFRLLPSRCSHVFHTGTDCLQTVVRSLTGTTATAANSKEDSLQGSRPSGLRSTDAGSQLAVTSSDS